MKKVLIIPAMIFSLLIGQVASAAFYDVTEDTNYAGSIQWMADNGVIQGYPDGTFKPDQCVNRAEFLKMMYLTSKKDIITTDSASGSHYYDDFFSDTSTDEWYWPYVNKALHDKTVEGYPDGTFKPGQCVNRAEAIKMATLEFNDGVIENIPNYYGEFADEYSDISEAAWYYQYLVKAFRENAVGLDHVTGEANVDLKFYPGESMSRKEVAEMLYRMKTINDNSLAKYDELQEPEPLNFYVSPSSGVSFMMTDGWEVVSDLYYETEGYTADYPTIMIKNSETEELLGINIKMMQCEGPLAGACYELAEGYTLGAGDPSTEAMFLINRILLTFREPTASMNTEIYNNEDFNLSFTIPEGWYIESYEVNNLGTLDQLILELRNSENTDVSISIATPPIETGYEGSTIEEGFTVNIDGLTTLSADLFRAENRNWLMARNRYYINEADWQSHITFLYGGPGDIFDTYLPDYLNILKTTEFSNS